MEYPILDPARAVTVHHQGTERQPVIVIDDVLADPVGSRGGGGGRLCARRAALSGRARVRRSRLNGRDARRTGAAAGGDVRARPGAAGAGGVLLIVTTPPEQLAPIQRLPHFDGVEAERIAVLIYLSGAAQGGTAFYRQRATGYESVDAVRYSAFEAALNADVAAHGLPDAGYIDGDTALYERVGLYEASSNRALIYRSRTLHCAAIPAGLALSDNPAAGRLSVNSFLFDGPRW